MESTCKTLMSVPDSGWLPGALCWQLASLHLRIPAGEGRDWKRRASGRRGRGREIFPCTNTAPPPPPSVLAYVPITKYHRLNGLNHRHLFLTVKCLKVQEQGACMVGYGEKALPSL